MPGLRSIIRRIFNIPAPAFSTISYWESRYRTGGNSGSGSYNHLAEFKADFLNEFLASHPVASAIEFGCGDGNQLSLIRYPKYTGMDVSKTSVRLCTEKFRNDQTKSFHLYEPFSFSEQVSTHQADLSLSIDVIFHIVEDDIYELYMEHVFGCAGKFVIIYSSDYDNERINHERRRKFTDWVSKNRPTWKLIRHKENPYRNEVDPEKQSFSDFYVFGKN